MATSASSSSSRSSNSENEHAASQDQDPTAAAQRLKLLNAYLLNSSLFEVEPVVVEPTKALEPVKAKHEQKDELQPECSVGKSEVPTRRGRPLASQTNSPPSSFALTRPAVFRLFSSAAPTKIVLQEAEERWPTVADPRIRTVEDEPKSVYKAREKAIKSVCIPGSTILEAKTIWGPLHPERVTHRRLVRAPNSTSDGLPRVAYFDYRLDTTLPAPTSEPPKDPSKLAKSTKPINHRGLKRRGLRCDVKMRLLVKPILKEDKGVRKLPKRKAVKVGEAKEELGTKEAAPSGWTSLGRKRLSKKRRAKKAKAG
ncbi:BZ3500_MvSof-1268-A1-R1_Chr3-1g05761 [Microbotryum saponariae]|uniref:BZ3500_MvSof-1268-A1-R1_Chr3-1g05761 protein n=1 Tax=Microbotryum saponariae TaxID=289078 RepID=A0A2X0L0S6_9BASI|nr:BZ3500_MvSof-1268-A1-R1_Chr3-1g05761 [Microbotryum saponariae]SDA04951.1 BZ3501_MvSof-1269-A2-R1_Chr3-1g05431 [Microbotryum saponariae]